MAASTPLSHANMNVINSSQSNSETGTATAAPDKEERKAHADAAAASKPYRPAPTPHRPPMPIAQPMTNLATPRGNQLGRAVLPTLSPFEQRNLHAQESAQRDEQARPAKRRKPEASPPSKSGPQISAPLVENRCYPVRDLCLVF
ncbi:hypothetical protein HYQ46_002339 [Verticillium longisporum]|nr:hypothetical protein HYQ46_002339 [Verticillium longisporum]